MTALEVRNRWSPPHVEQEWMQMTQVEVLQEMTAQLAELNATLKAIADPAVGISTTLCASNDTIPVMIRER